MGSKEYTLQHVEEMLSKLKAMPELDKSKRRVSKQEAVGLLSGEIQRMQERGYTINDIAEVLHDMGLEITASTLKNCLARLKKTKATPQKASLVKTEVKLREAPQKQNGSFRVRPDREDL